MNKCKDIKQALRDLFSEYRSFVLLFEESSWGERKEELEELIEMTKTFKKTFVHGSPKIDKGSQRAFIDHIRLAYQLIRKTQVHNARESKKVS